MCVCVCVCVRGGGRGSLFYNAPEHQISHKVIIVHRSASSGNSHPVSPLLFNLAYFMEEQKYQPPKPRQALHPLKIFLNMQHTSSKILAFSLTKFSFISCIRMWNVYTNFAFYCPPIKNKCTNSKLDCLEAHNQQAFNNYISGI